MPIVEEKDKTGLSAQQKDVSQGNRENLFSTGMSFDEEIFRGKGRMRLGRGIGFYSGRGRRRGYRRVRSLLLSRTSTLAEPIF